ncbi:MAG: Ribonuclease HII [Firmicutes bacterium ADurb.Bin153]|nr:MAG: Ribonuclease HII [Firmicutes bacterium ADurb.Bin153]
MRASEMAFVGRMLHDYDMRLRSKTGLSALVGVDEAGRGPIAGPVFAAAVSFDPDVVLECIYDSKALGKKARERAYEVITSEAACFGIASSSPEEIDELNIRQATLLAMRRAVAMSGVDRPFVVVDGKDVLGHNFDSQAVVGGDGLSMSIAAASILAKVSRDAYMLALDEEYPGYGFADNKGYPTPAHYEALRRLGPTPCHRMSFKGVNGA